MATKQREKALRHRENAEKRPHAIARYIRISSRKVKVVIDLIRGKSVDEAIGILMYLLIRLCNLVQALQFVLVSV